MDPADARCRVCGHVGSVCGLVRGQGPRCGWRAAPRTRKSEPHGDTRKSSRSQPTMASNDQTIGANGSDRLCYAVFGTCGLFAVPNHEASCALSSSRALAQAASALSAATAQRDRPRRQSIDAIKLVGQRRVHHRLRAPTLPRGATPACLVPSPAGGSAQRDSYPGRLWSTALHSPPPSRIARLRALSSKLSSPRCGHRSPSGPKIAGYASASHGAGHGSAGRFRRRWLSARPAP